MASPPRLGRGSLLATTALCGGLWSAAAFAEPPVNTLPTSGTVSAGQATIAANGNQMVITQGSNRAAINWQSYSIGANAGVTYVQPGSGAIALNRVTGNDPSQIFGRLTANGQVWLVNPNGILFGRTARIDVAGLVAATSNITDNEFMTGNGRFRFSEAGRPDAAIVNEGQITIRDAGLAAFVAPAVRNSGVITASLGTVALGAGTTFTLDLYGDRLVNLSVDPVTQNAIDAQGRPVRAGVENAGHIMADGGRVQLTANVARGVVDNVIRMSGDIDVRAARVEGGSIVLDGGTGGVEVAGTMNASGRAAGQRGGRVQVTGASVRIAPTVTIDAAGDAGGGTIEIGGGYRGAGPLARAQSTTVEAGARLIADALANGRGGTVVVWSDGATAFQGDISARGAGGGAGGLVEVSGHQLTLGGAVAVGVGGSVLFDPATFTVGAAEALTIVGALNGGGTVNVSADDSITVNALIDSHTQSSVATLNFQDTNGGTLVVNLNNRILLGANQNLTGDATTVNVANTALIQNGLDVALAGATVNVAAGTYAENLVISRAVTLLGAQHGVDGRSRSDTGATIIIPGAADPTITDLSSFGKIAVVTINANNVTIDGFIISGSNPALGGGVDLNGVPVHVGSGIYANGSGIAIRNDVFRNFIYSGIDGYADGLPGTVSGNNVITQNRFANITTPSRWGIGVLLEDNFYAQVTNNLFESVRVGVQTNTFYNANPGAAASISSNEIHATRTGIFHNQFYSNASPFTISNNTISALASSETREWVGIAVVSQQQTVTSTISGNIIDGTAVAGSGRATAGYQFVNITTSAGLVVDGGTVSNVKYGVWLTDQAYYGGPVANVTVQGVGFSNIAFGAITVEDVRDPAHLADTASVIIGAGNTYGVNVANQLLLAGAKPGVTFASGGSVDVVGVLGGGLYIETGNSSVYSGGGTFQRDNASINQAIGLVSDGGTVNVYPGRFTENVVVSHAVNLRGTRAGQDPTSLTNATSGLNAGLDPATNTIIDAQYRDQPGIWIQTSNVTVDGFTVINSLQAGIRVGYAGETEGRPIDGTRISNNYIYGNGNGILFQDAPRFSGSSCEYGAAACDSWCGEGSYAPGRFTNTIIDRNRIEQNNLVRGHVFSGEGADPFPVIDQRAGNHGIVFAGNTENTLVSRNYILANNGNGIFIAGSSYDPFDYHPIGTTPALSHANMAIVANRIENPGEAGIQVGRDYFYDSVYGYVGNGGTNYYTGSVSGLAIVLNTISGAFNCAGDVACQATVSLGKGGTTTADYFGPPVGLRGAIDFDHVTLQAVGDCLCTASVTPSDSTSNFISFLLGQGIGLLGAGITTADLAEALDDGPVPSTYVGYNLIAGAGYGVSIHSTVNLGDSVVYINNNNLDQNAKGGLFYALTASGSGSGSSCDLGGCYSYATGRVIAAGNYWGAREHQGGEGSPGNIDPVFGNMGPTFTLDVFANTGFRADIQGSGALPTYQYYNLDAGSGPYGWTRVPTTPSLYGNNGEGGVIVSSWRIDGNNQIGRLNEFLVNAQANPQAETPPTYPFPITLVVGGQFAGYLPTNFVRVDDLTQYLATGSYPVPDGASSSFVQGGFDVFRGPGAFDPSGRITRGVSTVREPLPLLASLVGVTLSPGATDNGTVDVLPGHYLYEGGFGRIYEGNSDGTSGLVLIDKDNLTIQATLYGVTPPATPAGLIPGTAPGWSYNPDPFDGTLNGRGFQEPDSVNGIPTRTGPFNSPATLNDRTEAVLWGGIAVLPNVARGLIAALAQFGGEGSSEAAQVFLNTAATNQVTISGMTIVNGFRLGQLDELLGSSGFFGSPYARVGVLIASGQNHVLRNNTIINCDRCSPPHPQEGSSTPAGSGGEGSVGVWIVPGDAVLANLFSQPNQEEAPQAPATGSGTQILQNNIFGWNTAGIMIDFPSSQQAEPPSISAGEGSFTAPTGIEIRRNTIAQTCTYGCFFGGSPEIVGFFGGAGVAIGEGVGVTITNNWFRDNQIGIFNNSATALIVENQFRSRLSTELTAIGDLPAIITTQPLVGASNWFDPNQTHDNFTNLNPAPDEFDHNPLLPGWQIFVPSPPIPPGVTPALPPAPVVVTFPSFARIPASGPFAFLADPFLRQLILGGGGGPSLSDIATAAGGTPGEGPGDPCAGQTPEQIANNFLGGYLLGNIGGGYQQAITCSAQ